jgi:hypothetical protein
MSIYKEGEMRFRVKRATVTPVISSVPFVVPDLIKMLFRDGEWTLIGTDPGLMTRADAKFVKDIYNEVRDAGYRNSFVLDIEEVRVKNFSS